MANKPGEANFFPDVPVYPEMGTFQPVYGKFDLNTYIQGASDYEIMAFLVGKYNACLEAYGNITKLSTDTITACKQLQDWINSWFDNLDVQEELNNKIDSMVQDGSFGTLLHQTFDAQINQQTTSAVTAWLVANVTPTGSAVAVDKSLSIEGAAADAKATGQKALYPVYLNIIGSHTGEYSGETKLSKLVHLNKNYLIWNNAIKTFTDVNNAPTTTVIFLYGFSSENITVAESTYKYHTFAFGDTNCYDVYIDNGTFTFTKLNTQAPYYDWIGSPSGSYSGTTKMREALISNKSYLIWKNALDTFTDVINKPNVESIFIWGFYNSESNLNNIGGYAYQTFAFAGTDTYSVVIRGGMCEFTKLNTQAPYYDWIGSPSGSYSGTTKMREALISNKSYLIWKNALDTFTDVINKPNVESIFIWGFYNSESNLNNIGGYAYQTFAFAGTDVYSVTLLGGMCVFNRILNENSFDNSFTSTTLPASAKATGDAIAAAKELNYYTSPDGNKWYISVDNDGNLHTSSLTPRKISFIGNSLLLGFGEFGMAASSINTDYYALVTAKMPSADKQRNSGSIFESQTTESGANKWIADNITNGNFVRADDDAVIIQLGDNVNSDASQQIFRQTSLALLRAVRNKAPNAKVYWCGVWYPKAGQVDYLTENCNSVGATFVNFTGVGGANELGGVYTLSTSQTTHYDVESFYANSNTNVTLNFSGYSATIDCDSYSSNAGISIDVTGKNIVITNSGIASHPGDEGMSKIANLILKAMNLA